MDLGDYKKQFDFDTLIAVEPIKGKDVYQIRFLEGPYAGVSLCYGNVSFPDEDEPIMNFEFEVTNGSIPEDGAKDFKIYIGDVLTQLIVESLEKQETVYTGGV